MRSPAYTDFTVRLREAMHLIGLAKSNTSPEVASVCSKSAAVLLAAALERYINAVLEHSCQKIDEDEWEKLPIGFQRFLYAQISNRLRTVTDGIVVAGAITEKQQRRLREAVIDAEEAFRDPSTWTHFPEFGLFMSGAVAPDRLNSVLRDFHSEGTTLFDLLEEQGQDRDSIGRSLTDLIEARHAVAHALPDRSIPSSSDVAAWAVIAFVIARGIEQYLRSATS